MKEIAKKYFLSGYSCSESVVQAAIDKGYVSEELLAISTVFSGGMGVRCLCGAIAGAQLVIGAIYGKTKNSDGMKARALAKEFSQKFMEKFKVNCCKILSKDYDFHSPERKNHCTNMVEFSAQLLESVLENEHVQV